MSSSATATGEHYFACRRCRRPLFLPHQLEQKHLPNQQDFSLHKQRKDVEQSAEVAGVSSEATAALPETYMGGAYYRNKFKECSSWFLDEPLQWMREQTNSEDGKLVCPNDKCDAKLGYIKWAGTQCSCGTWVTPAIQIQKRAVEIRSRETGLPN
eukprot:gb/GECG01013144.1/.p1 GENE.gb/GECG01013144.1/~~gb/GECG01013144.1/.p1  ORF type:complete len:155 (+),score=23.64 gb/GECG01013144.1/:1-465(+)